MIGAKDFTDLDDLKQLKKENRDAFWGGVIVISVIIICILCF